MRRVVAFARWPGSVIRRGFQVTTRIQAFFEGLPQRAQLVDRHDARHPGHAVAAKGSKDLSVAPLGLVVLAEEPSTLEPSTVERGAAHATAGRTAAPSQRGAGLVVQPTDPLS